MRVYALLNNYQMGSYSHSCLANKIVREERLTPYITKVTWDIDYVADNKGEYLLLNKAIGGNKLKKYGERI